MEINTMNRKDNMDKCVKRELRRIETYNKYLK
jgi:hypothetical protein